MGSNHTSRLRIHSQSIRVKQYWQGVTLKEIMSEKNIAHLLTQQLVFVVRFLMQYSLEPRLLQTVKLD